MLDAFGAPSEPVFDAHDLLDALDGRDVRDALADPDAPCAPRAHLRVSPVACGDPTQPLPELEARITELAGHLNAATHRFLALLAEFDRREGWSDGATRSCAHWLGWKCGIDLGAAREKVRVARALEALPAISAAMLAAS